MVQHDPSEHTQARSLKQVAVVLPAMNWNKASGRGLRTSLRSSQPPVVRHVPSQTSHLQAVALNDQEATSLASPSLEKGSINQGSREQTPGQDLFEISTLEPVAKKPEDVNKTESNAEIMHAVDATSVDENTQTTQLSSQEVYLSGSNSSHAVSEQGLQAFPDASHITETNVLSGKQHFDSKMHIKDDNTTETNDIIELSSNDDPGSATKSTTMIPTYGTCVSEHEAPNPATESLRSAANIVSSHEYNETDIEEGELSDGEVMESNFPAEHVTAATGEYRDSATDKAFSNNVERHKINEIIEIESDDDDDAMITNYSNAQRVIDSNDPSDLGQQVEIINLENIPNNTNTGTRTPKSAATGPQTLADLTTEQLEVQVRYFYITRDPATIPETDPVRCIICAEIGHLDLSCPAQMCLHCKTRGIHLSKDCPDAVRCGRCRGHHTIEHCKLKLKPKNLVLICDLCQEKGHVEADCELVWRSSGPLWKKPLPPLSIVRTCFNCGDSGHLGNDCRLRRPGKQMGSSMWSMKGLPFPLKPLTSADNHESSLTTTKKNKQKLPNTKAKGAAAKLTKSAGSVQSPISTLSTNSSQSARTTLKPVKGKPIPANIQIKGLANRASLDSPAYSPAPVSGRYPDRRDSRDSYYRSGYSTPTSGYLKHDQYHHDDAYNGYPRDRYVDQQRGVQSRPRSRSRSPRRWDSPPRQANYGTSTRNHWDRDDYNQNSHAGSRARQSWQRNGR